MAEACAAPSLSLYFFSRHPMSQPGKIDRQPGYVLMSQPWRETSLLIEVLTRDHGRLTLIARSARRPQSTLRGVLMPFAPLELAWFGKTELRTLHAADWQGGVPQLSGLTLLSGFYLNELVVKLTARDDPHPALYFAYDRAVRALGAGEELSTVLRRFELALLASLGYTPTFDRDVDGRAIDAEQGYACPSDGLPELLNGRTVVAESEIVPGAVLLALAADDFSEPLTRRCARRLTRLWLNKQLFDCRLATRELLQTINGLSD
ncbi:DNA repair protein RecO [Neisseriaceae bacterium JH1-16]|nr:DNA repair protein RecO [Neisseriaceae bacterium JH1-16]